jgi:sensor histidine kinase YesM
MVWAVLAAVHVLVLLLNQKLALKWSIIDGFVFNLIFAILGLGFWYSCQFISLERGSVQRVLTSHIVASLLVSLIWVALARAFLTHIVTVDEPYQEFLSISQVWRFLIGILLYFVLASFYYLAIYSENLREQATKRAELKALVHQAELKSLKFQINPHFIFNSLNSINSLTQTAPEKAGEMTVKLADFLRYTLSNNEKQENSLADELNSARLYLDIEKVRFGNKFQYIEEIEDGCLEYPVPNMILQPLMENAIKYGVYESLEPVTISFSCHSYGDYLQIVLENSFDPEAVTRRGEGIGLRNIESRMQMMYDQKNLLEVRKEKSHFRVNLYIPSRKNGMA